MVGPLMAWSRDSAGVLGGPGFGIQKRFAPNAGRLVSCGATGYHRGHNMEALVWTSDDGGDHWNVSAGGVLPGMQECQLVELQNGSVVINMRNAHRDPCDCRAVSISHDGGLTFSPAWFIPALIEPVCSAGLLNAASDVAHQDDLFFSNPNSRAERVNMTLKRSLDSGATWSAGAVVWPGPCAYSALAEVNVHTIGVVFEHGVRGPYENLSIALVSKGSADGR